MTFRVGSTRDLMTASGRACFDEAAFDELKANPQIEWEWMPEQVPEITPEIAARYDGLHINLAKLTADSIGREDCRLKIVARNGVGFDTVDVAACAAKGIVVTNTPIAIRRPVAVAAMTLILALSGRLFVKDRLVREGRWHEQVEHMGEGLTTRTLGLVGAGGIGQELIGLARPFFAEVLVADPNVPGSVLETIGARKVAFETVLEEADYLVVACPLNAQTHHLMDAAAFGRMKRGATFVNVARGPIHDEAALVEALRSGHLGAAGLDVHEVEPLPATSPLIAMDNVILTPHALCWTDECFEDIARTALRSIADVSLGRTPRHVVTPA
jgi:D-3-phosphoglycerate dehydrogenase